MKNTEMDERSPEAILAKIEKTLKDAGQGLQPWQRCVLLDYLKGNKPMIR